MEETEDRDSPPLELLHEDADLLVVCKPAGLLTHANREGERSVSGDLEESHGPLPEGEAPLRAGEVARREFRYLFMQLDILAMRSCWVWHPTWHGIRCTLFDNM